MINSRKPVGQQISVSGQCMLILLYPQDDPNTFSLLIHDLPLHFRGLQLSPYCTKVSASVATALTFPYREKLPLKRIPEFLFMWVVNVIIVAVKFAKCASTLVSFSQISLCLFGKWRKKENKKKKEKSSAASCLNKLKLLLKNTYMYIFSLCFSVLAANKKGRKK